MKDGTLTAADMAAGAITGEDIQDGAITGADIAAGVIPQIDADVAGSATAGPQGGINTATAAPLPLNGTTSVTPNAGDVIAIAGEVQFTLATTNAANFCEPHVVVSRQWPGGPGLLRPKRQHKHHDAFNIPGYDADGPFGLLNPGTPLEITAELTGDVDCTAGSTLDKFQLSIVQIR